MSLVKSLTAASLPERRACHRGEHASAASLLLRGPASRSLPARACLCLSLSAVSLPAASLSVRQACLSDEPEPACAMSLEKSLTAASLPVQ